MQKMIANIFFGYETNAKWNIEKGDWRVNLMIKNIYIYIYISRENKCSE